MKQQTLPAPVMAKERLAARFARLDFKERISALYEYFDENEVLFTTSFGINSAVLLHLESQVRPGQKVHFINTHHHFQETLEYKDLLTRWLDLDVVEVFPQPRTHDLTEKHRLWESHPEVCCHLNKVMPLERLKAGYRVWMSGPMQGQTNFRDGLQVFMDEPAHAHALRFYPLFDMTEQEALLYRLTNGLPPHPLEAKGFASVGCTHCTVAGKNRDGRWQGHAVQECGLHLSMEFGREV